MTGADATMKCERCGKDDAVIKLTRIEKTGQVFHICLCQGCAAEASPYQKKLLQQQSSIDQVLKELLKSQKVAVASPTSEGAARVPTVPPCPSCGLEYAAYKATYMLGCPDCYGAFEEELAEELQRLHRATQHVGEAPGQALELVQMQKRLSDMRAELRDAIECEDYERAAFLRDEIGRQESKLKSAPGATESESKS